MVYIAKGKETTKYRFVDWRLRLWKAFDVFWDYYQGSWMDVVAYIFNGVVEHGTFLNFMGGLCCFKSR